MEHHQPAEGPCASEGSLPIKDVRVTKLLFGAGRAGVLLLAFGLLYAVLPSAAACSPRSCFLAPTVCTVVVSVAKRAAPGLMQPCCCLLGPLRVLGADLERGKAALNARRLLDGKFGKNKVEVRWLAHPGLLLLHPAGCWTGSCRLAVRDPPPLPPSQRPHLPALHSCTAVHSSLWNTHSRCTPCAAAHAQPTQVIRPGQFMPGPIRESGLKWPLLIKGDR